jgi:drug/metabolite transporter (DMT)-like permease
MAVALAAAGQLMLKHGMTQAADLSNAGGRSLAVAAATNVWVLSGLLVFGVSALGWLFTLSRVPLNVAYPFNALGYLGILAASVLVQHERANLWTVLGSAMVVSGLIIVVTLGPSSGA